MERKLAVTLVPARFKLHGRVQAVQQLPDLALKNERQAGDIKGKVIDDAMLMLGSKRSPSKGKGRSG